MLVPWSWLTEYVEVDRPVEEVAERLAISSLEVERIVEHGVRDENGNLGRFVVGRVVEAGKHPNADRLQLCRVDVGEGEPRQIVCGAWNFGAGATVAVGLPGAVLPDGLRLERRKLRGEISDGMILSERELELGPDHTGILVLDEGEPGTPLADVLPLRERALEVQSTGNRGDLLSVYGIAREVAALFDVPLRPPPGADVSGGGDAVDIRVDDPAGCPTYVGRLFRDVRVGPSPPWLRARLAAAGQRPISNVVDVTNYVMLALGSPLHAFDHSRLAGGQIVVRRARPREELRTLDGSVRLLDPSDLVIADAERAVAIAGIMGGEESEVAAETETVLLEAANFEPAGILRSSERLRLRTEASNRWEKGVDPTLAEQAAVYATELVVRLTGARYAGGGAFRGDLPAPPVVRYRPHRADELIGLEVPAREQARILERLGFEVEEAHVRVPTWRARDVTREVDVVEEVARFKLAEVPFTMPKRRELRGRLTREQRLRRLVEDVLVGAGISEAYTWSLQATDPHPAAIRLPEPPTAEMALLRTELLGGLLDSVRVNRNAGNERIALWELARVYLPSNHELPDERWHLAAVLEGGYFRAKGIVEALYEALHVETRFEAAPELRERFGTGARTSDGWVAELRPELLGAGWGAFELDLDSLLPRVPPLPLYEEVIAFPAVKQDLAFVVSEDVPAGDLVAAAREAAGPELRHARVFDVYRGEQIPEGRKSVAIAVSFQSPERTLTDEDAAAFRARIVRELAQRFGAELRA